MKIDQQAFNQIATTLAERFDSLFYIDIETGHYVIFIPSEMFKGEEIPMEGDDFYALSMEHGRKYAHPKDAELTKRIHDKKNILDHLAKSDYFSATCRLLIEGRTVYIRHVVMRCGDGKHALFGMENIDEEVREKEEQRKAMQSIERMARLDELTGMKNKNAFVECAHEIDKRIQNADSSLCFGVVMCDINDLKYLNDSRGHNFGDEYVRRACRMICEVFSKSQVYRIGGDEFVVVLTGEEYEIREELLENLRRESFANGRSRSGPTIAAGMSVYDPASDARFSDVFKRADFAMYENKKLMKPEHIVMNPAVAKEVEIPVPADRKRKLDALFEALLTVVGEGYVYLNDLKYDYSRWAISLVDDFGFESEYVYHAGKIWQNYIHPDDLMPYRQSVDSVVRGKSKVESYCHRVRKPDGTYIVIQPRYFILNDDEGKPEYFGGILVPQ